MRCSTLFFQITVFNDCPYALKIQCDVLKTEPAHDAKDEELEFAKEFEVVPKILELEQNPNASPTDVERYVFFIQTTSLARKLMKPIVYLLAPPLP